MMPEYITIDNDHPEATSDEAQEDAVPLHSGDHRYYVRRYDDRLHFEFVSNNNSNINLVMNNHNKNSSITTPSISQGLEIYNKQKTAKKLRYSTTKRTMLRKLQTMIWKLETIRA